jgi:hypothetical protein
MLPTRTIKSFIGLFIILAFLSGCNLTTDKDIFPPIQAIPDTFTESVNATLPDNRPPWFLKSFEHEITLDATFIEEKLISSKPLGIWTSELYRYQFKVNELHKGDFTPTHLKFIRQFDHMDGVNYRMLSLRGKLRFYLIKKQSRYWITNITSIP